jgi:hypothetical protein
LPEACASLVTLLGSVNEKLPTLSSFDFWIAIAVYHDIEFSYQHSKASLGQLVKQQVLQLDDKFHKSLSWEILHFYALLQGTYYSFRILKQILIVLMSYGAGNGLPQSIVQLHENLKSLPPLSAVRDLSHAISTMKTVKNTGMVQAIHEILGITLQQPSAQPKISRREAKRNRKAQRKGHGSAMDAQRSSNPFALLDSDC